MIADVPAKSATAMKYFSQGIGRNYYLTEGVTTASYQLPGGTRGDTYP